MNNSNLPTTLAPFHIERFLQSDPCNLTERRAKLVVENCRSIDQFFDSFIGDVDDYFRTTKVPKAQLSRCADYIAGLKHPEVNAWLTGHFWKLGFPKDTVSRIVNDYFSMTAAITVFDQPYETLIDYRGCSLERIDRLFLERFKQGRYDDRRIAAHVNNLFAKSENTWHTIDDVVEMVSNLCDKPVDAEAIVSKLWAQKRLIERSVDGQVLVTSPVYDHYENEIARHIHRLQHFPSSWPVDKIAGHPCFERLSKEQQEAVAKIASSNVSVLDGCAGTGKSTITAAVIGFLASLGHRVTVMTSTGAARNRISELLSNINGVSARTLHSCLGCFQSEPRFDVDNPLRTDFVFLDESSMTAIREGSYLFAAIPDGAAVILIGDAYQLPSIDTGSLLRDLIRSKRVTTATLAKVHRTAGEALQLAGKIRNREEIPLRPRYSGSGSIVKAVERMGNYLTLPVAGDEKTDQVLATIYGQLIDDGYQVNEIMAISGTNVIRHSLNRKIQNIVNSTGEPIVHPSSRGIFRVGDRAVYRGSNKNLDGFYLAKNSIRLRSIVKTTRKSGS